MLHQFPSFAELQEAIQLIHTHGKEFYLTLNHTNPNLDQSMKHIEQAMLAGIDGLIVADKRLIQYLEADQNRLPIMLSVLSGIQNKSSLDFYMGEHVVGFCFERNVSITNMRKVIEHYPDLMATAFVSGNCQNTQCICQLHNLQTVIPIHKHEGGCGEMICEAWNPLLGTAYWPEEADRMLTKKNWCALCSLRSLQKAGIRALKIEGRSLELKYKLQKVSLYRKALDIMAATSDTVIYHRDCKALFETSFGRECNFGDCFYSS
ncbi:Peptidase family U32 [compost metagenome]